MSMAVRRMSCVFRITKCSLLSHGQRLNGVIALGEQKLRYDC